MDSNNRKPIISIIIPIYNTEDYLVDCFDSIINQSYRNFEVILVNDGSTDNSYKICQSYVTKDSRFRLFSKSNGGVSSARNLGLTKAKGKWISFIDSDDSIKSGTLELVSKFKHINIDIIQFGFIKHNKNRRKEFAPIKNMIYEGVELFYKNNDFRTYPLWVFFIKREIIANNKLFFTENLKYAEDLEFTSKCLLLSNNIATVSSSYYNYNVRENSAMQKIFSYVNAKMHLDVAKNIFRFSEKYKERKNLFIKSRVIYMIKSFFSILAETPNSEINYKIANKDYKSLFNAVMKGGYYNLFFIVSFIDVRIYVYLMRLKSKYIK